MKRKFILRLPPKSKILVYGQIMWVSVMLWLRDILGLPSLILYFTDVITIFILITRINRIKRNVRWAGMKSQSIILAMMIACILVGIVLNLVNPLLIIWATRNNMRFFAFLYICVGVLYLHDVDKILRMLKKLFWVNLVMCSYQYFVMGLSGDHVGGFFGIVEGCNAYINILLCIVIAHTLAQYFNGSVKMRELLLCIVAGLYIAVIAELKIFYVEMLCMVIVSVLCVRPSIKTVGLCLLGVTGVFVVLLVLVQVDPQSLMLLIDEDAFRFYISGNGYTNSGDLNRLTAIQQIYSRFFSQDPLRALFGFGFGNCETAQFSFLQSDFFKQYGYLHYRWFTHAWVYIEQGALGLILYVSFFVSLFIKTYRNRTPQNRQLMLTTLIFVSVCLMGMVYNCSLQLEASYMMAFMCAIPFIWIKETNIRQWIGSHRGAEMDPEKNDNE